METAVLKKKLQEDIQTADQELLEKINTLIQDFEYHRNQDSLMEESEEDIREGRVYSSSEMDTLIRTWKDE